MGKEKKKAIFKRAFKSKEGTSLVRLSLTKDDKNGEWCTTTDAVYGFAQKAFEENEKVVAEIDDSKDQPHVTRIEKINQGGDSPKKPAKSYSNNKGYKGKGNADTKSIEKQVVVKAVAETIKGIAPPASEVGDLADMLIEKYYGFING